MRIGKILQAVVLGLLVIPGSAAQAQEEMRGRVYPGKKHFLVLGEALATGVGGALGGTTLMHAMRVSAVTTITGKHGLDLTAARFQAIFPSRDRFTDFEYSNPEGDALILSYAQLNPSRARGIPSAFLVGGGIVRRNTSDPDRTRDTWIVRAGYDAEPFTRWSHGDATIGFHAYVTSSHGNNLTYLATLGLALRIG